MRPIPTAIGMILGLLIGLFAAPLVVHAHGWYENSCCSDKDCGPVPDGTVTETRDGVVVKGWGILSESDPRIRWSQDDRDHICAREANQWAPAKLICLYRKRKTM